MDIKDLEKLLDSKLGRMHDKIDSILEQTTRHNGRMTKLEEETEVVRMLTKYPKMTVLLSLGIISSGVIGIVKFFI